MRNILITLTLCVLTLTNSNVFAEGYDESRRTERLGLSFYDGRPLYVVGFGRLPGNASSAPTRCLVYRVYTGDKLSDYGTSDQGDGRSEPIYENGQYVEMMFYHYVLDDAGEPVILSTSGSFAPGKESEFVRYHLKNLQFTVSSGDIGVSVFDAISERSRPWLLPALGVALAFFGVRYCYRLLLRLIQGESGVGLGGATDSNVSASRGDNLFSGDYARTSSVATSDNDWETADVSNADEYATGEALGQEFTPKAVASNVDLQNEWSRLSESERAELLGDDFGGAPFGGRAYPRRQGNYYVDLERDNYYVDLTDEDER